jgi:hypothetical protein
MAKTQNCCKKHENWCKNDKKFCNKNVVKNNKIVLSTHGQILIKPRAENRGLENSLKTSIMSAVRCYKLCM